MTYLSKRFSSELFPVQARIMLHGDPFLSLEVDGACLNLIKSLVLSILLASPSDMALSERSVPVGFLLVTSDAGKIPSSEDLEILLLPKESEGFKALFLLATLLMADIAAFVAHSKESGFNKSSLTSTSVTNSLFIFVSRRSTVVGRTRSRRSAL